jgi:hypothetical protein
LFFDAFTSLLTKFDRDFSDTIEERQFAQHFLISGSECMHIPRHVSDKDVEGCNKIQTPCFDI